MKAIEKFSGDINASPAVDDIDLENSAAKRAQGPKYSKSSAAVNDHQPVEKKRSFIVQQKGEMAEYDHLHYGENKVEHYDNEHDHTHHDDNFGSGTSKSQMRFVTGLT